MTIFHTPTLENLREGLKSVGAVWSGDRELDCRIAYALGMDWIIPDRAHGSWRQHVEQHGFEAAWISDHVYGASDGVPCFSSDLNVVFWAMEKFVRADEIKLAVDPSGIGARVGRWRLQCDDGPQWWPLGVSSHARVELAFMSALLRCLIHEIETGSEMVAKGYVLWAPDKTASAS